MKVVILAGGFGLRLSEVTEARPKPMVETLVVIPPDRWNGITYDWSVKER